MSNQMPLFIERGENSGMPSQAKRNFPKNVQINDEDKVLNGCIALMVAVMRPVIKAATATARTRKERRAKMLALSVIRDNALFALTVHVMGDSYKRRLKRSGIDIGK